MLMSTEYIVKFSKNVGNMFSPSEKVDGFVELSSANENTRVPTISVRTCKKSSDENNISLLYKFITSNFANVSFDDDNKICSLLYKDGYSRSLDYESKIEFDSSSSSAYSTFKNEFEKLLNCKKETEYYDSGRVKYIGDVQTDDDEKSYQGEGTLYYDSYYNRIKYSGEFDDNQYDGAGKFYNYDNNVVLVANNISNGIPVQKGKLHVNFRHRQEMIDVDFDELWFKFELTDKSQKRKFANSDNFVNMIAASYLDKTDKKMSQLIFEDRPPLEQNVAIWSDLQEVRKELMVIRNDINVNMTNMVTVTKALTSVLLFSLLVNLAALYFS